MKYRNYRTIAREKNCTVMVLIIGLTVLLLLTTNTSEASCQIVAYKQSLKAKTHYIGTTKVSNKAIIAIKQACNVTIKLMTNKQRRAVITAEYRAKLAK